MNRAAIRNLVAESIGRTDGSKDSLINSAIDLAVVKVSLIRYWPQLQVAATVAIVLDDLSVALATDAIRVTEIRLTDGTSLAWRLKIRQKEWIVRRYPDPSFLSAGKPRWGYIENKTLFVLPKSDASYTIDYTYFRVHPALATDTDSPLIDGIDAAIVSYAIYWVFRTLQQLEDAKLAFQGFRDELSDAIRADRLSVEETIASPWNERMPVSPDYWLDPFVRSMP